MKTPMQEVYENFNLMSDADFKSWMLNTDLLEKEKGVIMYAHHCGRAFENKYAASAKHYDESVEQYYNETFNTKEK
jgi:methenyltetrahydromethanopterin cyclohydrolase